MNAQSIYNIERMSFNTMSNSEMAPVFYNNGLIFSSDIKNEIVSVTTDQSGGYLYNLYVVEKKKNDKWSSPVILSKSLMSKYNVSSASVSNDGKILFYTSNFNDQNTPNDTLKNGIFIAAKSVGDWIMKESFQFNNSKFDVGYPCISKDGKRLYFSARNPEGYGGFDIYYCDKIKNAWGQPVNIGADINTTESEVYPYIYKNTRLYFSSNKHDGAGALDIYYSDYLDGKWQKPVNLPKPINSKFDDFSLIADADFDTGYFASNRNGSDDIYRFVSMFPAISECPVQIEEKFCYDFYEAGTLNLDTTSLKYEWDFGDGMKIRNVKTDHCYAKEGEYEVSLNVIDTLTGEVSYNQAAYDLKVERAENPYILAPDTAYVGTEILFDASKSRITKFKSLNYFWDFGDEILGTKEKNGHAYVKSGIFIVRLGITGNITDTKNINGKACIKKQIVILERNK